MKKSSKKILVVDDDEAILDAVSLVLRAEGYVVQTIEKPEKIFTYISSFKPDIIFLDVLMSGSDGREICKKIKKQESIKHIPLILFSAHPSAKIDMHECLADDFLAKPFEVSELLDIVSKHIL